VAGVAERAGWVTGVVTLLAAGVLFFAGLGHYALWDDESYTALAARGVLATGDTSVVLGDNIVAFRGGILVRDGADRSTPPLMSYAVAGSFLLFGEHEWAARLPAAIFGLGTVGLLLWRIRREALVWRLVWGIAILGNVSLFLFCRQSRYYAAGLFFSVLVVLLWERWRGGWRSGLLLSAAMGLLFAANQMGAVVLGGCLMVDWVVFRRRELRPRVLDVCVSAVPAGLLVLAVGWIWNPLATGFGGYVEGNSLRERLVLLWWNLRDLNAGEFVVGGLLVAALAGGLFFRSNMVIRGLVLFFTYCIFMALVSPQPVEATSVADIRYLVALIPLGMALEVWAVVRWSGGRIFPAVCVGMLVFWTTLLQTGPAGLRSTMAMWWGELLYPRPDPYRVVGGWIGHTVGKGESVAIFPPHMAYPLMFMNPSVVFAWQLDERGSDVFPQAGDIHFRGRKSPDWMIAFGPSVMGVAKELEARGREGGWRYRHEGTIDCYWRDLHRPEVFWRSFQPVTEYDRRLEAVQVFRREGAVGR
jgi:hypothetical protein